MQVKRVLVLAICLLPALVLASADTEKLLSQMRDAYKAASSATLTVQTTNYQGDQKINITAVVNFMAPNKLNAVLTGLPGGVGPITLVCDGKQILVPQPSGDNKVDYTSDMLSSRMGFANLETLSFWDFEKQLSTAKGNNMEKSTLTILPDETVDGHKFLVLQEDAVQPQIKLVVHYYIDPETHLIWRVVTENADTKAKVQETKITEMKVGAKVDPALFSITSTL